LPLHPSNPRDHDRRLACTSIPQQQRGCQRLARAGRDSSPLRSLPPPAASYSLFPYCFPALLALAKTCSNFHKREQRKVLKCRELSRQHTESPLFLPHQIFVSLPVSSSYKHPIPRLTQQFNKAQSAVPYQAASPTHGFKITTCSSPVSRKESSESLRAWILLLIRTSLFSVLCGERGGQS